MAHGLTADAGMIVLRVPLSPDGISKAASRANVPLLYSAAEAVSLRSQCASHQQAGMEAADRVAAQTAQLEAAAAQLLQMESQALLVKAEATDLRRELAAKAEALAAAQVWCWLLKISADVWVFTSV